MQSYRYSASINRLQAGMDYSKASRPARLEDGTGSSTGYGCIDAYLHKGKATLWGNAAYRNGTTRNVRFCETTDYPLLYPYLMADTVGGNTHGEYYHFMGGFSYPWADGTSLPRANTPPGWSSAPATHAPRTSRAT